MPTLPIFPSGSLDSSIITTTWVGIYVVAFFNMRLGWVLSGLVVPGYLVPLIIIKPWAATVILVEGIVAYLLVVAVSERLSRLGGWSSLFGRDRFFALVLASIAVRLLFDAWALPALGAFITTTFNIDFDYHNNLYSFGLIIVALIANLFWKTGILRGLGPVFITLAVTYLIVRYGLMELTNFRISSIGYLYEDISTSILATPKAYIVLVLTAYIASRLNLLYGWEFNGILIPALIALQWYQPFKIFTSVAEAFVILWIARALLATSLFANVTMEGARKILLFFNIGFALKMALGWFLPEILSGEKVTDYFGFGYLLSTLIAIKIHDKDILPQLTRATVQTSFVGAVAATAVGFGLTLVPTGALWAPEAARPVARPDRPAPVAAGRPLDAVIQDHKLAVYGAGRTTSVAAPGPVALSRFDEGVDRVLATLGAHGPDTAAAELALAAAGYAPMRTTHGETALLPVAGRPDALIVLDGVTRSRLAIEVPDPLAGRGLVDAATALFKNLRARSLMIAGTSPRLARTASADVRSHFDSSFQAFHSLRPTDVLQVTTLPRRAAAGRSASELRIKGSVPPSLDLPALTRLIGPYDILWGAPPGRNLQAATSPRGFAVLRLTDAARRRLLFRALALPATAGRRTLIPLVGRDLGRVLRDHAARIAGPGSEGYHPPRPAELLLLDAEVISPLLSAAAWTGPPTEVATRDGRLDGAAVAARGLGLHLGRIDAARDGAGYVVLAESDDPTARRGWGLVVVREGPAAPIVIQVPRPSVETHTLAAAGALAERVRARALIVSGAHPAADANGAADVLSPQRRDHPFTLASLAIQRDLDPAPILTLQVRGFRRDATRPRGLPATLLATADDARRPAELAPLAAELFATLAADGRAVGLLDPAEPAVADLSVSLIPQASSLKFLAAGEFAILWLADDLRAVFGAAADDPAVRAPFALAEIPTQAADLAAWVVARGLAHDTGAQSRSLLALDAWLASADVIDLVRAAAVARGFDLTLTLVADTGSGQLALAITDPTGAVLSLTKPIPGADPTVVTVVADRPPVVIRERVERFLASETRQLIVTVGAG